MSKSKLQIIFLENLLGTIRSSRERVNSKLDFLSDQDRSKADEIVWEELKGVMHGLLCEFDGATSLADHGLVSIVDENGDSFDRYLHELCFDRLTNDE
ncbi:hypothetical protein AYI82_21910 [Shewanella algae]|uniref:hypothetical protein n=1 Tax=Shewanella algae TaxID=38313 RepID=UPI0011828784|nr:hypothetical protein [Shewanella algae]TVL01303.1 hypothetical protein AYI82_21910 [Shewanella algae]